MNSWFTTFLWKNVGLCVCKKVQFLVSQVLDFVVQIPIVDGFSVKLVFVKYVFLSIPTLSH